jgi:hypothetical protein
VTVLIALLSNESGKIWSLSIRCSFDASMYPGSIQQLSCGTIANMLCWEAQLYNKRRRHRSSAHVNTSSSANNDVVSVYSQVMACNGHKSLFGLLTSPSA